MSRKRDPRPETSQTRARQPIMGTTPMSPPRPMIMPAMRSSRRNFLASLAAGSAGLTWPKNLHATPQFATFDKAQIAITLDLEMARNFPRWEDTRWDYEKGNLNQAAKDYAAEACRRVKKRGG